MDKGDGGEKEEGLVMGGSVRGRERGGEGGRERESGWRARGKG